MTDKNSTKEELINQIEFLQKRLHALEENSDNFVLLKEAFNLTYQAIGSSASGIIITNLKDKIAYVNNAFLRMFEFKDKEELIGQKVSSLFPSKKVKGYRRLEKVIESSENMMGEFLAIRKNGSELPVEITFSNIINSDGKISGKMFSFIDITERRVKDKLFSIIAHDLRGAIGNLITYEEVILEHDSDPALAKELLNSFFNDARNTIEMMETP